MKISSLGIGTIVFSLGIFFFNYTSGQGISGNDRTFMSIIFEEVSIIISIATVMMMKQNMFEDMKNAKKWLVILNVLGLFSVLFITTFFNTQNPTESPLTNYLVLLGFVFFLILLLFTLNLKNTTLATAEKEPKKIKI